MRQRPTLAGTTVGRHAGGQGHAGPAPESKRYSLLLGAMVWILISFFVSIDFSTPGTAAVDFNAPNPLLRTTKLSLLVICVVIAYARLRYAKLMLRSVNPFFLAFMVMAPLSYFWSISPPDTIARCISLITIVLVCFAFTLSAWHSTRFQNVLRPALTLFCLGSIYYCLVYPELGIEKGADISLKGSWHGLAAQKNEFGQVASFGTILWIHSYLSRQLPLWRAALGAAITGLCLLSSRSSTSIMSTAFACMFLWLVIRATGMRRYLPYLIGAFATLTVTYALAVLGVIPGLSLLIAPVMSLTGKDTTFSGRTPIWQIVKEHIQLSPYVGTGYGAYWIGDVVSSPSSITMARLYFYPTESHNGYLEIINDLGFVGLFCLAGYLFVYVRDGIRLLKIDRNQAALLLGMFFQQVINNLSESFWFSFRSVSFDIMALATVTMARTLLTHQLRGGANVPRAK